MVLIENRWLRIFAVVAIVGLGCQSLPTDPENGVTPDSEIVSGPTDSENGETPNSEAVSQPTDTGSLELFDFHAHQMPSTYPENWLDDLFFANDLRGIALLGIGDVFTHQRNHPSVVYAFSNFKDVNNIDLAEVESQLERGSRGIGEVSIRHFASGPPPAVAVENDFNEPDLLKLYDLAKQYNVPVNFHFDYHENHVDEIVATLPAYPDVKFVWAHAGDAQPEQLAPLLGQFDNLYIDISSRNPLESFQGRLLSTDLQRLDDQDGIIKAEWKKLFSNHATRVLYGSDIGPKGRLEQYEQIEEYYRGILMQVDAHIAENIAYSNAEKIFGFSSQ